MMRVFGLLLILTFLSHMLYSYSQQVNMTVYYGGEVNVSISEFVNSTPRIVEIKSLGTPLFLTASQSGQPLTVNYTPPYINVLVYKPGIINVSYITETLTQKVVIGANFLWEFKVNASGYSNLTITLPQYSFPLAFDLNTINLLKGYKVNNFTYTLMFQGGYISFNYTVIPPTSTNTIINPPQNSFTFLYYILPLIAIIPIAVFSYNRFRRRGEREVLDERDAVILRSLEKGEKSFSELMKELNIPKSSLHRRLRRMIKEGYIEEEVRKGVTYYRKKK